MLYDLPYDIQELIFDFSGQKLDIQTHFKDNIAPQIDKTIKKKYCELCYIQTFKSNEFCLIHSMIDNTLIQPKYYSLHNLPNGRSGNALGKLFLAINNIEYFQHIISDIGFYNTHKLSDINNEIRQKSYV